MLGKTRDVKIKKRRTKEGNCTKKGKMEEERSGPGRNKGRTIGIREEDRGGKTKGTRGERWWKEEHVRTRRRKRKEERESGWSADQRGWTVTSG